STSTLYARTGVGTVKSTNGGGNWEPFMIDGSIAVASLAIDPLKPTTLYAGLYSGDVLKSANGGASWGPLDPGLEGLFVRKLTIDPVHPANVYAATSQGVFSIHQAFALAYAHPAMGLVGGGSDITIRGWDLAPTGTVTVTIGGVAAAHVTMIDATTLTATIPAHPAGAVNVVVTNPDGHSATLLNGFVYANVILERFWPMMFR